VTKARLRAVLAPPSCTVYRRYPRREPDKLLALRGGKSALDVARQNSNLLRLGRRPKGLSRGALIRHLRLNDRNFTDELPGGKGGEGDGLDPLP